MPSTDPASRPMRTVRFHRYGPPEEVLVLETAGVPEPEPGQVRVAVHACGLNPADWALCNGLFAGDLPRGIGLEVSGIVDRIGDGVADVAVGDLVVGPAPYLGASAGASDLAVLDHWTRVPAGLDPVRAAALPMAVETAYRGLDELGVSGGQTVLIHGAGSTVGFAAVQFALLRGARVIVTAGATRADELRALGAEVTSYGDGMVDRVASLAGGSVDFVLDAGPVSGVLPNLVEIAGDADHVLTLSDFEAAAELGVRVSYGSDTTLRYDVLPEAAQLAAEGRFTIPIARTFALTDWPEAVCVSQSGRAGGKLVLLVSDQALATQD